MCSQLRKVGTVLGASEAAATAATGGARPVVLFAIPTSTTFGNVVIVTAPLVVDVWQSKFLSLKH
jgi:hypothetical protein